MNRVINIVKTATELAHRRIFTELGFCEVDEDKLYVNQNENIYIYTEEAQLIFNTWYDYYYDILLNLDFVQAHCECEDSIGSMMEECCNICGLIINPKKNKDD